MDTNVGALIDEGRRYVRDQDLPKALSTLQQCVERDPKNPEAWAWLGRAKVLWDDNEEGLSAMRKAISLRPEHAQYYYFAGRILSTIGRHADALVDYERTLRIEPDNNDALVARAETWLRLGGGAPQLDRAIAALEGCLKTDPAHPRAKSALADAYLDKAVQGWVQDPEGGARYATSLADIATARGYIQKAEALAVDDDEIKGQIAQLRECIGKAEKRTFVGRYRPGILAVVVALIALSAYGLNPFWLFYLCVGGLYFVALRQPGYVGNRKAFDGDAKPSLLERRLSEIYELASGVTFYGSFGSVMQRVIFMRAFLSILQDVLALVFLPLETAKALFQNYRAK